MYTQTQPVGQKFLRWFMEKSQCLHRQRHRWAEPSQRISDCDILRGITQ